MILIPSRIRLNNGSIFSLEYGNDESVDEATTHSLTTSVNPYTVSTRNLHLTLDGTTLVSKNDVLAKIEGGSLPASIEMQEYGLQMPISEKIDFCSNGLNKELIITAYPSVQNPGSTNSLSGIKLLFTLIGNGASPVTEERFIQLGSNFNLSSQEGCFALDHSTYCAPPDMQYLVITPTDISVSEPIKNCEDLGPSSTIVIAAKIRIIRNNEVERTALITSQPMTLDSNLENIHDTDFSLQYFAEDPTETSGASLYSLNTFRPSSVMIDDTPSRKKRSIPKSRKTTHSSEKSSKDQSNSSNRKLLRKRTTDDSTSPSTVKACLLDVVFNSEDEISAAHRCGSDPEQQNIIVNGKLVFNSADIQSAPNRISIVRNVNSEGSRINTFKLFACRNK